MKSSTHPTSHGDVLISAGLVVPRPRRAAMTRTTAIRVRGATWTVPRGFGRAYADAARDDLALVGAVKPGEMIGRVVDLLALVGYAVTVEQVASWDLRRRVEAVVYASTEHARASDNPVPRHPRLSWLPDRPWQGPQCGMGAFAGPSGTPITEAR